MPVFWKQAFFFWNYLPALPQSRPVAKAVCEPCILTRLNAASFRRKQDFNFILSAVTLYGRSWETKSQAQSSGARDKVLPEMWVNWHLLGSRFGTAVVNLGVQKLRLLWSVHSWRWKIVTETARRLCQEASVHRQRTDLKLTRAVFCVRRLSGMRSPFWLVKVAASVARAILFTWKLGLQSGLFNMIFGWKTVKKDSPPST